jgi:hypothetical protein
MPLTHRLLAGSAPLAAAVALAACGSGTSTATTTSSTTGTTSAAVQDLGVTPAVRTALLAAGAAGHHLPIADFTGLRPGLTYYAYDPGDATYWAGAQLVPSPASQQAGIVLQDDGAYDVFTRSGAGPWVAFEDGLGTQPHARCVVIVPAAVRTAWGWSLAAPCGGPAAF